MMKTNYRKLSNYRKVVVVVLVAGVLTGQMTPGEKGRAIKSV